MIKRLDISGVHAQVDEDLRKSIQKKIGRMDRYLPRNIRPSVHCEVFIKESKASDKKECTCEVVMYLPAETISIKESTVNMYAAVDIVETKLKGSIKKYKDKHANPRLRRHLLARIRKA